ncbi:hypothetical protein PSQ19_08470 [Devosia algicola]|uniref:Nudix hydrolase domain-containing protein n=1 Tax=Devosia algicola TaxID=3026418 RepID=A0ABY7YSK5_9HYPH|nr:hypothetical protein [Devosia algicola]WDR04030.1 hypothetical protein PSQ19_08470 [Devosia algicola]
MTVFNLTPVLTQALGQNQQFQLAVFTTTSFEGRILPSNEIKAHQWIAPSVIGALRTTTRLDSVLQAAFALSR